MSQKKEKLTGAELVNPYNKRKKKGEQVEQMFDSIAPAYDFMNTAMTFGLHRQWRKKALNAAQKLCPAPFSILDVATGTGDVAFDLARRFPDSRVKGVDLSEGMLKIAAEKTAKLPEAERSRISFKPGDSLELRFADNMFDMVTVAYGVRNFEHLKQGLREMWRVMHSGGVLCIIELSCPENPLLKWGYNLYSRNLIPAVGRLISGDSRAYSYLPESIAAAPQRRALTAIMEECGFRDAEWHSLTMGVVTYYLARK